MVQNILLAFGALGGILLAYVESLPSWDDTRTLAGSLLGLSCLITLLGSRRPWLVALAVGAWIPLHEIYVSRDVRMLLVLLIPLGGTYFGCLVRRGFEGAVHSS